MNILNTLKKEQEKGALYIDGAGEVLNIDKLTARCKKDYTAGLKSGSINFSVSYYEFLEAVKDELYPIADFIADITASLSSDAAEEETEREPEHEPEETTEPTDNNGDCW